MNQLVGIYRNRDNKWVTNIPINELNAAVRAYRDVGGCSTGPALRETLCICSCGDKHMRYEVIDSPEVKAALEGK